MPRLSNDKKTVYWGVPWEEAHACPQARRVGNTIYVSGQLSHDEAGRMAGLEGRDDGRGKEQQQ